MEHRCPGHFSNEEKQELQRLAVLAHSLLELRHYSRSDFIVHPKRGIFFLEADAVPDLFDDASPYIQSLHAIGSTVPSFIEHVLQLALERK